MEHLSSDVEQQIQWRRDKVQELCSKGYSQREMSQTLQIGLATVNRDVSYLRTQAKANIKRYIDERLPEEYEKCLVGLNAITKEAWNTAQTAEDIRVNGEKAFSLDETGKALDYQKDVHPRGKVVLAV
jgi:NADH/NAD ratio-sensing transcriptional regulator Rex